MTPEEILARFQVKKSDIETELQRQQEQLQHHQKVIANAQAQIAALQTDLADLDLGQLFKLSDQIGDKYLSPEEIEARNRQLEMLRDYPTEEELIELDTFRAEYFESLDQ